MQMNRKTFLILFGSVFSLLIIISIVLIKTGLLMNERTVIDVVEENGDFKVGEPLVVESLISGRISKITTRYEDAVVVELTEADAKEIVNLLTHTKVNRTAETPQSDREMFYINLNNNGYTMPYQIDVSLTFQLNEEENAMIFQPLFGVEYETEDLTLYNKLNEIIEKTSVTSVN